MSRALDGGRARIPARFNFALIAEMFHSTPESIRAWPAQDYYDTLLVLREKARAEEEKQRRASKGKP